MASYHPNSDLLMSYGAGALGESWSLALATHLTFCPSCRSIVDTVEEFGGALLEDLEPDPMSVEGFESIIAIDLPKKRALMHLDTIFTRISEDEVLIFPPILDKNFGEHLNKTYIHNMSSKQKR